jgi:DNA-binding response OmpR family regulator
VEPTEHNPQGPAVLAEAIRRLDQAEAALAEGKALLRQVNPHRAAMPVPDATVRPLRYLMVSKGQRKIISERAYAALKPEKFRFFLDLAGGRLLAKGEGRRPAVRSITQSGLQSEDIHTLAFLVEHPGQFFGADNLAQFLAGQEMLEANTLAHRMVRIRREVQPGHVDGPFLRRATNVDTSVSRTGFGFYFDSSAGPYCLVRFAQSTER